MVCYRKPSFRSLRLMNRLRPMMMWSTTSMSSNDPALTMSLCHAYILGAGCRIAAWVVVNDDNRSTVGPNCGLEDFADAHHGSIEAAGVDCCNTRHEILGVEQDSSQLLLVQQTHLHHE